MEDSSDAAGPQVCLATLSGVAVALIGLGAILWMVLANTAGSWVALSLFGLAHLVRAVRGDPVSSMSIRKGETMLELGRGVPAEVEEVVRKTANLPTPQQQSGHDAEAA